MPGPMVTVCSSRKLSSYLVRAKLYHLERVTGSCKCHRKCCEVCLNVNQTSTLTSSVTHETYQINHKFDCNSKCFVYLLTYKKCSKQYVKLKTVSGLDGTIIKIITENINVLKRVCRNIFLGIFQARVIFFEPGFSWWTVSTDFWLNTPGYCTKSQFAADFRTGKFDGKACVLHCVY